METWTEYKKFYTFVTNQGKNCHSDMVYGTITLCNHDYKSLHLTQVGLHYQLGLNTIAENKQLTALPLSLKWDASQVRFIRCGILSGLTSKSLLEIPISTPG